MQTFNPTFILRFAVAVILFLHSIPGIFNNGINDFGNLYLNEVGFRPVGVPIAWLIKISHIVCAFCLLADKFIKPACIITIIILVAGIFMVHLKDGWFVVGGGRNGVEFNFLLIFVLLFLMFQKGLAKGS